jgi:nudix-type nucleoside diphosphatase (YffH/AdpP family)
MTPSLRLLEKKALYESPFLQLSAHRFALREPGGGWSAPETRLVVDRGDSVAALLVEPGPGLVHLVRQFRYVTYEHDNPDKPENGWLTELVAGIREPGESPEACIIREVAEETGFVIEKPALIGCFYLSPGAFTEKLRLFAAEVSPARRAASRKDGRYGVEDEAIETLALPIAEFLRRVERMEIADAKTIAAAEWLRRRPVDRSVL